MSNSPFYSASGGAHRFKSDEEFDGQFSPLLRQYSTAHWSPLGVAAKAALFLTSGDGNRVLDIGSGVGKFCLAGAYIAPDSKFFGVERRVGLFLAAQEARLRLGLNNVAFIHADCADLRFREYDHFFFYSPFYENLAEEEPVDDEFVLSIERFQHYSRFVFRELLTMPVGTRLCTFKSLENEIPVDFRLMGEAFGGQLKFWERQ
jgi:SAM-dependent methyltransferase